MGEGEKRGSEWMVERRYRAVLEVLDGSPVSEVAVRYGVSRQSVYAWKARHAAAGIDGKIVLDVAGSLGARSLPGL